MLRPEGEPPPALVLNPLHDGTFVSMAEGLAASGTTEPAALAAALRRSYPNVVVRARGLSGEGTTVLYVYRDGQWVNGARSE